MTKRRQSFKDGKFTPKILEVYKQARALYDDDDTDEFEKLQRDLNILLDRTAPWLTDIFDTVGDDAPPDWAIRAGGEQAQNWQDAKVVLAALEKAAT